MPIDLAAPPLVDIELFERRRLWRLKGRHFWAVSLQEQLFKSYGKQSCDQLPVLFPAVLRTFEYILVYKN
jgi:hypothetical protein